MGSGSSPADPRGSLGRDAQLARVREPCPPRLAREEVQDRSEDDDREHADDAIQERDRRRLGERHLVHDRQDADDPSLHDAEPGRAQRDRGEQGSDQRDEDRPGDPELHAREVERLDDEEQAHRLGHPDRDPEDREAGQLAPLERPEDALLEAVVELHDAAGERERDEDAPAEVAQREQRDREEHHDEDRDAEHRLDLWRQAAAEAPVAGGDAHDGDREDVEDPLDEHGPEGPTQRRVAVDPQQVGTVHVAELGRDDAVDEPREEEDLGRVRGPDPEAGAAQQDRPAQAAQREARVEDEEGDDHERRVGAGDEAGDLRQRRAVQRDEEPDDEERDEDRDERLRLAQPAAERDPLGRVIGGRYLVPIAVAGRGGCPHVGRLERHVPADGRGRRVIAGAGRRGRLVVGGVGVGAGAGVVGRIGIGHGRFTHEGISPLLAGDGGTRRFPRTRLTSFATGVSVRTIYDARPGTSSTLVRAASNPSGVDGSPSSAVYATPTSSTLCESLTATPGSPISRANACARSLPDPPTTRALCVSTQSTSCAMASSRGSVSIDPRKRSKGCGIPTRPPWALTSSMVSRTGWCGATARSRNTAMRSPSAVLISSPTITWSPSGAASRARRAPSMRS